MLKKSITFKDLEGHEVTEDYYFHLSKADLVEMEVSHKGGLARWLQSVVDAEDGAQIIAEFKKLILSSYGEKSDDNRRFVKSQALRDEFMSTEAYSTLFLELCTDAGKAAEFVNGIVGQDTRDEAAIAKLAESQPEGHPSDPAATPAEPRWPPRELGDGAPEGRNVFEGGGEADPTAVEPRILSKVELEEMDADELQSGLASGRFTIGGSLS